MVNRFHITIHQILHGYSEGHRFLSGSYVPEGKAAKTLLNLSDSSGPSLPSNHEGYLTGYPVPNTNYYIIAKTWPAPEKSRPGCVWTHSLLIDVSDLALIKNPLVLLDFFRRPKENNDFSEYKNKIRIKELDLNSPKKLYPEKLIRSIIAGIYSFPDKAIVVDVLDGPDFDRAVLEVWAQQWPKLKRSFRFCTFVLNNRSVPDSKFDLQGIVSQKKNIASGDLDEFLNINSIENNKLLGSKWVDAAVDDVTSKSDTSFRSYIWKYGADSVGGRSAFKPLAESWIAIGRETSSPDFEKAISVLKENSFNAPTLIKQLINLIIKNCEMETFPSVKTILYILNNLTLTKGLLDKDKINQLVSYVWKKDSDAGWSFIDNDEFIKGPVAKALANVMSSDEALLRTKDSPEKLVHLIARNPMLAANPIIWVSDKGITTAVAKEVKKHPEVGLEVSKSMLLANSPDLARLAFGMFGNSALEALIGSLEENISEDKGKDLDSWLSEVEGREKHLLPLLDSKHVSKISTLATLSGYLAPNHRDLNSNKDTWVTSVKATGEDPKKAGLKFCAFLLARGLSEVSSDVGPLITLSFDPIYSAAKRSKLKFEYWEAIKNYLPSLPWYQEWDWCLRLRMGVAQLFVKRGLPAETFFRITKNEKTFKKLVAAIGECLNGHKYLRFVEKNTSYNINIKEKWLKYVHEELSN
jgi:hypothetical protein